MARTSARPFRAAAVALTAAAATVAIAFGGAGVAQAGYNGTVHFAPGTSGTVIDGAVVRGDADNYYLEARRGQTMSVFLTSLEGNANFSIAGPDGPTLLVADTYTEIVLPAFGYYRITVCPTRGNATYSLHVEIR
ncbi:hypothetical protein [Nocardia arizonensis]|uniref:hypothetical protein n=1 Tax=Nocardia arizonensis TaxID=1141647 RepID=UPI0006D24403|nr:hypothetical protein [Nocardia arizonensis]